jgi:heme-degrading monooxygenase HmoA
MIIERVEVRLKPGDEQHYMQAIAEMKHLILGAEGCRAITVGRGVEDPSKALLLVTWDAVERHIEFTKTSGHAQLVARAGPFVESAAVEHFFCI